MTPPLPLPVRVAAGLLVTTVEHARDLPRLALELPVTAVSQALQASMRVQQTITELALKGDRLLGVGAPVEDEPAWATFDEDLPPRRNGAGPTVPATPRPAPDPFDDPGPVDPGSVDPEPVTAGPGAADAPASTDGPPCLPDYPQLTIAQLRAKLRQLGEDDLAALLTWEQAHADRPPYVTMLTNRITAVTEP